MYMLGKEINWSKGILMKCFSCTMMDLNPSLFYRRASRNNLMRTLFVSKWHPMCFCAQVHSPLFKNLSKTSLKYLTDIHLIDTYSEEI
jgi:hypothetical protein